jgi:hypothetical protein
MILRSSLHEGDGPKVAQWFYEDLLSRPFLNGGAVAYALDCAAGRLRDSGVSAKRCAAFIHMGA